ncbi:fucolectin-like [Mustelus asterias]
MKMIMLSTVLCIALILKFGHAQVNLSGSCRATQSSVYDFHGHAMNAVDGNLDPNYLKSSCTATQADMNPWWRADLHRSREIHSIRITNRKDCCAERLNGAEIRIGDSLDNNGNNNPKCATIKSITAGHSETFECGSMQGRYVNILIPGRNEYLTLCEVEIYGTQEGWVDC